MFFSTLDHVPGRGIEHSFGLVQGSTVRSKHVGRDIMAGLKGLVGGELRGYTELLEEARAEALARLAEGARALGADAVVGLRFGTASITSGASEILAYGTAVRLAVQKDEAGTAAMAAVPTYPTPRDSAPQDPAA